MFDATMVMSTVTVVAAIVAWTRLPVARTANRDSWLNMVD